MNIKSKVLELCGITDSTEASSSSTIWDTNQTSNDTREQFASVYSLLEDYVRGITSADNIDDLPCQMRVDTILILSLDLAKEKVVQSLGEQARRDVEKRLETLFWGDDQFITVPEPVLGPCGTQTAALDHVLWFGDTRELQTNLIVLRAEEPLNEVAEEQYCFVALTATAMIHHSRARTPGVEGTYGVVTDGLTLIFLHVNKEGECSSIKLNWLEGNEHAIVGIIGRIIDQAVGVKMICEDTVLGGIWSQMAGTWDSPRGKNSEVDEMQSLEVSTDNPSSQSTPSNADNMDFLNEFYEGCKGLMQQAAARGENFEARLDQLYQATKFKFLNKFPGNKTGIQSPAATSIDPAEVDRLFGLTVEQNPGPYWRITPWEIYQVSSHLQTSIERITRVFGLAKKNEAALRLFIDAVFLDVPNAIKEEAEQHEAIKGKGKRPSTESMLNLKDIYMGVETEISYILATNQPEGTVIKKVTGRMDYNVWYGQPREAETNMLVVQAKQRNGLLGGRYQAMTYMALIQRARFEAGRARIPIYGIATDSELWDFIRMDGQGNVDVKQLNWKATNGSHIISLLHKIIRAVSAITPAATRELTREHTLTGQTSLTLTDKDGNPL